MRGSRRLARPVRITLATLLGSDIDGAWWPRTASVAGELPELIEALHRPLGEINHIGINWSSTERAADLDSMSYGGKSMPGWRDQRQRIMVIAGCSRSREAAGCTAPDGASPGWMVLRRAAAVPIPDAEQDSQVFHTADLVMRAAQVESASWAIRTLAAQAAESRLRQGRTTATSLPGAGNSLETTLGWCAIAAPAHGYVWSARPRVTPTAWGPFGPCSMSNWTRWFSSSVRKPLPWTSE